MQCRSDTLAATAGIGGLILLAVGVVLLFVGVEGELPVAGTLGVVLVVLGLVGLRVRAWIHHERRLRTAGRGLVAPGRSATDGSYGPAPRDERGS